MTPAGVIDGSLALAWVLPDERDPVSDDVLAQVGRSGGLAPSLWRLEVAHALIRAERRGRIDADQRRRHMDFFSDLPIVIDPETGDHAWTSTLDLAERHALTIYDACYLELALRTGLQLATRDRQLRAAAEASGVRLLG